MEFISGRELVALLALAASLVACTATSETGTSQDEAHEKSNVRTAAASSAAAEAESPMKTLDPSNFDRTVSPCEDLDQFTNGGWKAAHPIPADRSAWDLFTEIQDKNEQVLRAILEEAARDERAAPGSVARQIGDFWCSCMDEDAIEAAGVDPLAQDLARIASIETPADVVDAVAAQHARGGSPLFAFSAEQDLRDASRVIAWVYQAGLGLPDRDYYTRDDEASVALRGKYVEHVERMLVLAGGKPEEAAREANSVLAIETRLAAASMTNVEQRDPQKIAHPMSRDELVALSPGFDWTRYFESIGVAEPAVGVLNVAQPDFVREFTRMTTEVPAAEWQAYLRWHLISDAAPYLSRALDAENFAFFGKTLQGTEEQLPRWKRCLQAANGLLGEAVGQAYVARTFSPEAKRRANEMVDNLRAAFAERVRGLAWMSPATKERALAKLAAFTQKIGYPDRWRDYSSLVIDRGPWISNVHRARAFEFRRVLAKIGKPVDRAEWGMPPAIVNAYYNPLKNEIVFPAGILQPPYFSEHQDDATNYGAMGAVIGHELTHGFDDQGSQFDPEGNLNDWWTAEDRAEFMRRAQGLEEQYSRYVVIDDLHVDGKLTLGENIADLGGVTVAWHALQRALARQGRPAAIDGFSPEQRFFLAWAQAWRSNKRPEALRMMVHTNPHAPARFRANVPPSNLREFHAAFGCSAGALVRPPEDRVEIW